METYSYNQYTESPQIFKSGYYSQNNTPQKRVYLPHGYQSRTQTTITKNNNIQRQHKNHIFEAFKPPQINQFHFQNEDNSTKEELATSLHYPINNKHFFLQPMNLDQITSSLKQELRQSTERAAIYGKIYPELLYHVYNAVSDTEKHFDYIYNVIQEVEKQSFLLDSIQKQNLESWINQLKLTMKQSTIHQDQKDEKEDFLHLYQSICKDKFNYSIQKAEEIWSQRPSNLNREQLKNYIYNSLK